MLCVLKELAHPDSPICKDVPTTIYELYAPILKDVKCVGEHQLEDILIRLDTMFNGEVNEQQLKLDWESREPYL